MFSVCRVLVCVSASGTYLIQNPAGGIIISPTFTDGAVEAQRGWNSLYGSQWGWNPGIDCRASHVVARQLRMYRGRHPPKQQEEAHYLINDARNI